MVSLYCIHFSPDNKSYIVIKIRVGSNDCAVCLCCRVFLDNIHYSRLDCQIAGKIWRYYGLVYLIRMRKDSLIIIDQSFRISFVSWIRNPVRCIAKCDIYKAWIIFRIQLFRTNVAVEPAIFFNRIVYINPVAVDRYADILIDITRI